MRTDRFDVIHDWQLFSSYRREEVIHGKIHQEDWLRADICKSGEHLGLY